VVEQLLHDLLAVDHELALVLLVAMGRELLAQFAEKRGLRPISSSRRPLPPEKAASTSVSGCTP